MTDQNPDASLEQSRRETRAAFENRALMYYHIYTVLTEEFGSDRAVELLKRAIHRRGLEVGAKYEQAGKAGDLEAVGRLFCEGSPCGGALFHPAVEELEEGRIVLSMQTCPLVDAWRAEGLSEPEIDVLCDVSNAVDEGTFERAGLDLVFLERLAAPGESRCVLELRVPADAG
jgi:hypothetical protein